MKRIRGKTWPATLMVAFFGLLLLPCLAAAVGTEAGSAISNYATGTYTDANANTYAPVTTNTVSTTVSQVGGIDLTPLVASQDGKANVANYYPLTLTNTGNGDDTYNLTYNLSVNGGGASDWTVTLYVDQNGDGILDANDLVGGVYVAVTSPVALGSDESAYMIVVVTPGPTAVNGNVGILSGTATSNFDSNQTLSGAYTTTVSTAVVTLTKTTSPSNPQPGDTLTYTISYSNSGSDPAYDVVISDVVPSNTTYVSESIKLNTVTKTDQAGDDEAEEVVSGGTTTIKISLASIANGASGSFTFQVTVNEGVAEFSTSTNSATITYNKTDNDTNTSVTNNSNNSSVTVSHEPAIDVAPATYTTNKIPGDLNVHPFTVKNTSNGTDTYNLTSWGLYWTWTIYNDVNENGLYDSTIDTLIIDTNSDGIVDTGEMLAGEMNYYVATTTVTGTNGQIGQHIITGISITDNTITDTSTKYTPIQTPVITMSKAVSPTGNQPPGTELTYTITVNNTGAAQAVGFFVSDILSSYLDFTEGSITVAGASQTDANDTDLGRYDSGSNTVLVSIPTISAGTSLNIVFKATIK